MSVDEQEDTRTRLLEAAVAQIAAKPGGEISLRAVCAQAGVTMPTLYHFFGSKRGLLDAVVEHGFDLYLARKAAHESSGDPIADLREGWDEHVAFGLQNPGLYALMYGTVRPGYSPESQSRPSSILQGLTRTAAAQGRLVVSAEQAAAHVLVANIGVTLRQITSAEVDRDLSIAMREGTIAAITGTAPEPRTDEHHDRAHRVIEHAVAHPEILGTAETRLLVEWLERLATAG